MLTNATYKGLSLCTLQTQGVVTTERKYEASRPLVTTISYNGLTGTQMQWERSGNLHSRRSYDGEASSYRYDGINRLQGVDYPTGNVNLSRENSYVYSYDDNGNPLTFAHDFGKMTHSYTAGNQVQQTTHSLREAKKYGYDYRGNRNWEKVWNDSVTMLQDVKDDMWQLEKIYTWNAEDELVGFKIRKRVGKGLDSMEYRYHYDENHRKVYAEKRVSDVAEWQPVREYVWDGVQVVYEKDLQRGEKTYFAVDGVEHVAEVRVGNDGTKKVLYRLNDHLGGLERLVDAQGKVVGSYRFEPYGKLERYAGSEQSRYAWGAGGKEWVEELGWYEFGRRKYDAQLGGWVSRDPKEQFASMYATGANPLNSVDVDGEAVYASAAIMKERALNMLDMDKFKQDPVTGQTYCNYGAQYLVNAVGLNNQIHSVISGKANVVFDYLNNEDNATRVSAENALILARAGVTVIAAYKSKSGGSGHLAVVSPETTENGDLMVFNVGPSKYHGHVKMLGTAFSKSKATDNDYFGLFILNEDLNTYDQLINGGEN